MKSKWVAQKVFDHRRRDVKAISTMGVKNTLTTLMNKDYLYHTAWRAKEVCLRQIYGDEELSF